ncbi:hypothetical protein HNR00_001327 [Methylorubrum rhodinum]|uniref:Uncharacterized protein n=1 Tax=Methylorubrum rhodinum TaxID=29428 RepID=A0A840ZI24_9HYPH|nr:hypothetical protein [Methylorubrum rhodinum]MBB5756627.1 hypothetical protein [Methylorubrum rhodinum]
MTDTPTPKQALILWCLLGRHGGALQSEVAPKIDRADREALIAGRYVEAARQGRSLRLTVTDRGWAWAADHMRDPLPPGARVLQDWLALIHRHLDATGATLADLVGLAPEPEAAPPPAAKAKRPVRKDADKKTAAKPKTAPKPRRAPETKSAKSLTPKTLTPKTLRARIEDAYLAITGGERATAVRLSALRARLSDLDRATVDAGLAAILKGDARARLSQFTDPKSLDAAERAAAYSPAGEPFHLLWIQS